MSLEFKKTAVLGFVFIICVIYLLNQAGCDIPPRRAPRAIAFTKDAIQFDKDPEQSVAELQSPFLKKVHGVDYLIEPQAKFRISARVVSRKRYYLDHTAFLAPVDLALAWGALADHSKWRDIEYDHGNRFYHFRPSDMSYTIEQIYLQSANIHIIPADLRMKDLVKNIKIGDLVVLEGYLVNVSSNGGFTWKSSLVRTDRGGGACELMYLVRARVADRQY